MVKKLVQRGRHTVLPIVGDQLVELCLRANQAPSLVFETENDGQSVLTISDSVMLGRGLQQEKLDKPGLSRLLELLGCEVTDAMALEDGQLHMAFSNQLVLEVSPTTGYEAWHFQYPRPGRSAAGHTPQFVSVIGAHGHLIF